MMRPLVALSAALALLFCLAAPSAQANLVVDPSAAALGSSTIWSAVPETADPAETPELTLKLQSPEESNSSDLYLVEPNGRLPLVFSSEDPDASTGVISSGAIPLTTTLGVTRIGDGDVSLGEPTGWVALDRNRGGDPIVSVPMEGRQPRTAATPAPEPATVMLLACGLVIVGAMIHARRRGAEVQS